MSEICQNRLQSPVGWSDASVPAGQCAGVANQCLKISSSGKEHRVFYTRDYGHGRGIAHINVELDPVRVGESQ